jgi:hypothetical protein
MERTWWLVTILWFFLVAAGGTALALVMSDGKDAGWVVIAMLLVLALAAAVWRRAYRWAQQDQERWRVRLGRRRH